MPLIQDSSDLPIVPLWINGAPTTSNPPLTFPVHSSSQHKDVYIAQAADIPTAQRAASAAWDAFHSWRKSSYAYRRDLLLRVASIYRRRTDELVKMQMEETSCQEPWARMNVSLAIGLIEEIASKISGIAGEIPQTESPDAMALVFNEPVGPVLAIAPWNASVVLASRTMATPIGVGCTVVFKASELCPRTHHALLEMFEEAGLPKGVLNVIQARREDGAAVTEALIAHPSIRKIEFIGSRAIGAAIGQTAAKYLKPVLMELGGKSAALVLDDANLKQAAMLCFKGAILHHGQICFSTERIIVQEKVAAEFQELLKQEAAKADASAGNGVTLQMVKASNDKLVEAQEKGAKFLVGGPSFDGKTPSLMPTIVTGVTAAMKMFDEETFGPSVSLYVVKDDKEAIELANASEYGLNAAVHTTNMERGIEVARQIDVRQVHINNLTEHDEPTFPVGGMKGSGWGTNNAKWGVQEFLIPKLVVVNMKQVQSYV